MVASSKTSMSDGMEEGDSETSQGQALDEDGISSGDDEPFYDGVPMNWLLCRGDALAFADGVDL
ncbi:hypothetical protein N7447_007854 [Penicillium robsamsonii]|uniref:uncharacterized protein n=1 Tax=Penicillium robsamsonii TaxID=1792511 RepID=UPI002548D0C3|nr:uncharacterized protein N7447_007854 [Penicillium robsamsonii]KAJ5817846.1 hypothetical protein N7447_007854 [Penicillium robsamsonii]